MRPICLKIAGLNSFREVQEIDFSKLCETGVFGIFGSTGSGKSSILDAITLALYGTVERAANNTQGILNHAEKQLTVEYAFSLAAGSQRITYRAERAYRRSGDRTVKASTCRLIEISEGIETVIASKADEMTKKIETVLGLNVEDFTRAVVLPQGKFAEFLTIKPKDRRLMLERLFSLETYGRELSTRLSEQLGNAEFNLNGVEQRQQGLGDASDERVKEAEADLRDAIVKSTSIAKELKSLNRQYDIAKELWGLQEQLHQIQEKETQLKNLQTNIDKSAERLSLAERAETIRPLLEEASLAEERFKEAKGHIEDSETKLKDARREKEIAEGRWIAANQTRLEAEPRCLRRLEQLEQAKSLESDIHLRHERLTDTRFKYSELDRTRKELEQTIQVLIVKKSEIEKQKQEVKFRLSEIAIDPVQRTQVNASAQVLEGYEMISKQVVGLQKDFAKITTEIKERKLNLETSQSEMQTAQVAVERLKETLYIRQQDPPIHEEILSEQAQELERYRHRLANIERTEQEEASEQERLQIITADRQKSQVEVQHLEEKLDKISLFVLEAKTLVERKAAELKGLEQENLAGILVETLVEGENCPVCGSTYHPRPAQSVEDGVVNKSRNDLDQAAEELQRLEGKRTEGMTALAVAKARLSSKQELEQNQLNLLETKKRASGSYREELLESDRDKEILTLIAQRIEQEVKLSQERLVVNQWKTEQEQLNCQLENAQQKLTEVGNRRHALTAQLATTEGVGKEMQHRLNLLLEEQAERKNRLDSLRGSIALTDILGLQKQYATWDQTTRTLNQELSRYEEEVLETEETRQRFILEKTSCELELQNLKTVGSEAARELAELKSRCDTLTEGKPAQERIEQLKQELAYVTGTEEKLKQGYEGAKERWTQAEQIQAVRQKTLELSRDGFEAAQRKLEQGLEAAQFVTLASAQSALCDETERMKIDQAILAFRQDILLCKQKREEVEERLDGRSLRPEEWLAWPVRLKEVEKAHTETIERRGATQQRLEKLNKEHEEWMRLDGERQALSHRRSLLKTLQAVFKGNAFVEFIAQEQLSNVSRDASERLKQLTNQRYALEVDTEGGFIMRDDANGGVRRPVSSLSGGETFLTALALALALSTQIQLRGESPLEFFFLDEGFGTLDANLLETVMNTLEKLHLQNLTIGIISHVPELKNRLARRLVVTPADAGGAGSRVSLEMA